VQARVGVTPVVLSYNEEPNLGRTLESLRWAGRVVVVDSGSSDRTEDIARRFGNVSWHVRSFDSFAGQWGFALRETGIESEYALLLDADHQVPAAFVAEIESSFLGRGHAGAIAGFEYVIYERRLGGSLYPPKLVIARPGAVRRITQPGHCPDFEVEGPLYRFRARLVHDDRKPIERFVRSQLAYSQQEAARILAGGPARWPDRLRRTGLMAPIAAAVAFARAGGPFRGAAAIRYACERATFECLLAMRLMTARLERGPGRLSSPVPGSDKQPGIDLS
jgi:glycosyltransferase involved in cell wall biosynthesis